MTNTEATTAGAVTNATERLMPSRDQAFEQHDGRLRCDAVKAELDAVPDYFGGDYYGRGDMTRYLAAKRSSGVQVFGADAALAARFPDSGERQHEIARLAQASAGSFDANSLLIVGRAIAAFDIRDRLSAIRASLLYVLSRSDRLFPATLPPSVMKAIRDAGVDARFFEIDSDHGHFASSTDAAKWAERLRDFFAEIDI
jgi:homoserine O-acetyltransferase